MNHPGPKIDKDVPSTSSLNKRTDVFMNMLVRGVKAKCQFDISISEIRNHAVSSRRQVLLA